jgi:hypothetical protein
VGVRFPFRADCPACGRPVLILPTRRRGGILLAFDPEPDGDGGHYDTVLADDKSHVTGSGDAIAAGCEGRVPLYRAHAWSCPQHLGISRGAAPPQPAGTPHLVGGYWYR